jgi:aryl-alcohol dehydrogenase-like predicted oxidoreductase
MQYRILGKTGLKVSEIGYGAGDGFCDPQKITDTHAVELMHRAVDLGVNFFDTAASYGFGHSERRLGLAFKGMRDRVLIATKCISRTVGEGKDARIVRDWSAKGITQTIEESLKRLEIDYVDLLQFHSPQMEVLKSEKALTAVQKIKQSGKARFIGISSDMDAALYAISLGIFDTLQTTYSALDQKSMDRVLPAAHENQMGIIIKTPTAQCVFLRGRKMPEEDWMQKTVSRAKYFDYLNDYDMDGPEIALRFALEPEMVSTVIPGTTSIDHLINNIKTSDGKRLDKKISERIKDTWKQVYRP